MKHKYFSFFIAFTSFLFLNNLQGQEYSFSHYTVDDGLSQSVVNCLFQDSRGFIWIGTQNGLNRYDGYSFKKFTFNPLDTNSLSNNWIYGITEDNEGNIWTATRKGVNRINKSCTQINRINIDIDESCRIYGITIDKSGRIICNKPPYVCVINPKTYQFVTYKNNLETGSSVEDIGFPIIVDKTEQVWLGTSNGLVRFNLTNKEFKNYQTNPNDKNSISFNFISEIFEDKDGAIWIGTYNGLNCYDRKNDNFIRFFNEGNNNTSITSNSINAIVQDKSGCIWLGTEEGGLFKITSINESYKVSSYKFSEPQSSASLVSNNIVCLLCDKTNNLWIGTLKGLDKIDLKPYKFALYRNTNKEGSTHLLANVIASVCKDKSGKIWIGNWGQGLNCLDRISNKVTHYSTSLHGKHSIKNDFVHYIFEDSNENIWIGTRNYVQIFDKKKEQFVLLSEFFNTNNFPDFNGNRIYQILEDYNHNIWIATRKGLYYLNITNYSFKHYIAGKDTLNTISDNLIYALALDKNQNLWIATSNGLNLYNFETGKFKRFYHNPSNLNSLCSDLIPSLCVDSDNNLWIGTQNGANFYNPQNNTFQYFGEVHGLVTNSVIYEIQEDKNKNIWFATGQGLYQYVKNEKKFKRFGYEDGLQSNEFNLKASFKSSNGELFFGGMNGLNSFYPDSILINTFIPNLVFTFFEISDGEKKQQIQFDDVEYIELDHKIISVNIEFSALEFSNSGKNNYAYKIEGLSNEWINIGNRNFVSFTKLPAGDYTLWIKGSNNDGIWNEQGKMIKIKVNPPWYYSSFAIVFYMFALFIGFILLIRYRINSLIEQKIVLEKNVRIRTEEIEKQKNQILEQNRELQNQKEEILLQNESLQSQKDEIEKQAKALETANHELEKLSIVASETDNAIIIMDKDGNFEWVNGGFTKHFDYTLEELCSTFGSNIINASTNPDIKDAFEFCKTKKKSIQYQSYIDLKNGEKKWVDTTITPIIDSNGNITKFISIDADITDLKNAEIEIINQRNELAKKNEQIKASILYAKTIQNAILPNPKAINEYFDNFIIYQPKDIVSGDFYWFNVVNRDNKEIVYISVADCTGHGVPGAFMSMIGCRLLTEIVNERKIFSPNSIVAELSNLIRIALKQDETENTDGMDISLGMFEKKSDSTTLTFCGARNDLLIYKNISNELICVKADRIMLGGKKVFDQSDFTNQTVELGKDDIVYMLTDGLSDQNNIERKRFGLSKINSLLQNIVHFPMTEQKITIEKELEKWMDGTNQRDDITLLGIKI